MTSIEDLYVYYCRRNPNGPCKPNSTLCKFLRSAEERKGRTSPSQASGELVDDELLASAQDDRHERSSIVEIDLSQNYVGPVGLEPVLCVCRALKSTLRSVRLANNMLQHSEVVAITHHLSGRSLKTLITDNDEDAGNGIAADGECAATQAELRTHPVYAACGTVASLSNTALRQISFLSSLDLRSNLIHDGSVPQLLYFLRMTPSVTELLLEGNQLSQSALDQIDAQLQKNRSLVDADARAEMALKAVSEEVKGSNTAALSELKRLQKVQLPHTSSLHGTLTESTSGGYFTFPSWRRNPQYAFHAFFPDAPTGDGDHSRNVALKRAVLENRKVTISLKMDAPTQSTRRYGFCVLRGTPVLRVVDVTTDPTVLILESDTSDAKCTAELDLAAIPVDLHSSLVIMVYSFTPGKATGFTLKVELVDKSLVDTHPGTFVHVEPLNPVYDWIENSVEGAWKASNNNQAEDEKINISAGGPITAASWRSNTAFRVCLGGSGSDGVRNASQTLGSEITMEAIGGGDEDVERLEADLSLCERAGALVRDAQEAAAKMATALVNAKGRVDATAITSSMQPSSSTRGPSPHYLSKSHATMYIVLTQMDSDAREDRTTTGSGDVLDSIGFYLVSPDRRGRVPVYLSATTSTGLIEPAAVFAVCDHRRNQSVGLTVDIPIHLLDFFIVPTTDSPLVAGRYVLTVFSSCGVAISPIASPDDLHNVTAAPSTPHNTMWRSATLEGDFAESDCGGAREAGGTSWMHNPSYEFTINDAPTASTTSVQGSNLDVCLALEITNKNSQHHGRTTASSNSQYAPPPVEMRVSLFALSRGGTNIADIQSAKAAAASATRSGDSDALAAVAPIATFQRHELVHVASSGYLAASESTTLLRNEISVFVESLPPGRYVVLINTRTPEVESRMEAIGYRVRMFTSASASSFYPLTRKIYGLLGSEAEKESFLLSKKQKLQEAKMKTAASFAANNATVAATSSLLVEDPELLEQAIRTKALRDVESLFADVASGGIDYDTTATADGAPPTKDNVLRPQGIAMHHRLNHAPILDSASISLSDRLRVQQLQDYEDEAAFDAEKRRGGGGVPRQGGIEGVQTKFPGCNVAELIRQGRKFVDREFPPASSSLWLDPEHEYPDAPRVVGWKRATEVASLQCLQVVERTFSGENGMGGGKLAKSTLETLLARRGAALGVARLFASSSAATIDAESANALRTLENTLLGQYQGSTSAASPTHDEGLVGEQLETASHRRGQETAAIMARISAYATTQPLYGGCGSDVDQAHLGCEWYLSALACVLSKPATFGRRFIVGYNPEAGVAQFRFYIDNAWQNVLVDDSLPVDGAGELCFGTSASQGDFLVPLVEKAYAKVHRCYGALHSDLGVVKKNVLGADAPATSQGSVGGVLVPTPPVAGSGSSRPQPLARPHSQPVASAASAVVAGRIGGARGIVSSGAPGLVGTLDSARNVVLSTDPQRGNNFSSNNHPRPSTARAAAISLTCPDNDCAPYGAVTLSKEALKTAPKRPFYDHGGEPALVMLSQALTDFTGGIVQIFDNTPATVGTITQHANSVGNNALPSDSYHAAGILPPNMSIAISGSLYIDEDAYLNTRDGEGATNASSFSMQQRIKTKKDAVWEKIKEGVFGSERVFAGALMKGTHGWHHKKHSGLQFDALYPFIDAKEADGRRVIKVFNNWNTSGDEVGDEVASAHKRSMWWKGKYAWGTTAEGNNNNSDGAGWTPALKAAAGYDLSDSTLCFWMSLEEVLYYFSHFFQVDYPAHVAKCEGGYGATHVGGSLLNSTWVNNHQYQMILHTSTDHGAASEDNVNPGIEAGSTVEVVIGIHQINNRRCMPRERGASYTYSKLPIGLALIQTPTCVTTTTGPRRLALLTPEEQITTLHPAALRDRYFSVRLPVADIDSKKTFILMPYVERVGDKAVAASLTAEVGGNGRLFTHEADEVSNPFLPPQSVNYCITVRTNACPVALEAIAEDTRVMVAGEWSAQNGVGIGGQVCAIPSTPLPLTTIQDDMGDDSSASSFFTAGGPPAGGTWRCNPQFLVYPSRDCVVTITLRQTNVSSTEYVGFHLIDSVDANLRRILHFPDATATVREAPSSSAARLGKDQVVLSVAHCNDSVVMGTVALKGVGSRLGRPYHLVPSCLRAGPEGNFTMEISTNVPVKMTPLNRLRDWKALSFNCAMSLLEGNAGGCIQYPTWRNNPQYLLTFPTEKSGRLLLGVSNLSSSSANGVGGGASRSGGTRGSLSAEEPIGLLLLRPDGVGKGRGRKLVLSNAMASLVPTPTQDLPQDTPDQEVYPRYPESQPKLHSQPNPTTQLLEDARRVCDGDICADTGASLGHSEMFFDVALNPGGSGSSAQSHLILMPYTLHPLTEANLQITIYSTMDVEVDAVEERVGGYMRGLANTATSSGSIASFASNAQRSTRGLSNFSSIRSITSSPTEDAGKASPMVVNPPPHNLSLNRSFVCTAEGQWVPGVSAGGCRRHHLSSWVNNPFFRVTLLPAATPKSEGLKMVIVAIQYPDGPEKPEMKKITTKSAGSATNSSTRVIAMPPVVTNVESLAAFTKLHLRNATTMSQATSGNGKSNAKGSLSVAQRSPFALDLVKTVEVPVAASMDTHQRAHSAASDVVRYVPVGSTRYTYESEVSAVLDSSSGVFGGVGAADEGEFTDPHSFYIVPHTYEPECAGYFKLIVYCNLPIQVAELKKGKRFW